MISRLLIALVCIGFVASSAMAGSVKPMNNGYHIVVSTYKDTQEKEAAALAKKLTAKGLKADYGLEEGKHFIYVFVDSFEFGHFDEAVKAMTDLRKNPDFKTAWVIKIKDGREIKEGDPVESEPVAQPTKPAGIVTEFIENPPMKPIPQPQNLGNSPAFFSVMRDRDGKIVDGEIKVYDAEKSKLIATAKTNLYYNLPDPKTKSGKLTLVATAFGYSDAKIDLTYYDTQKDTSRNVVLFGTYFQLIFPMEKMKKGQAVSLSKIAFFNDAAIMTPTSKDQLQALLEVLKDNPTTRIRINGHTNGNGRGKIIYVGPSKNYFALSADRIEKTGSAKDLSLARAQAIKDWLVSQGIADDRIEALGWGGTKPVFDKNSPNARMNGRVEFEVIAE